MKGLFIVIEGIDGAGTTTQRNLLDKWLKSQSKYPSILCTREPYDSPEIEERLRTDNNPYSDPLLMMHLYVQDRKHHTENIILPMMNQRAIILCDRYRLSTDAYQTTQGMPLEQVLEEQNHPSIIPAQHTIWIDTPAEIAMQRVDQRNEHDKFGKLEFQQKLVKAYKQCVNLSNADQLYGPVHRIDGNQSEKEVLKDILSAIGPDIKKFLSYYTKK